MGTYVIKSGTLEPGEVLITPEHPAYPPGLRDTCACIVGVYDCPEAVRLWQAASVYRTDYTPHGDAGWQAGCEAYIAHLKQRHPTATSRSVTS